MWICFFVNHRPHNSDAILYINALAQCLGRCAILSFLTGSGNITRRYCRKGISRSLLEEKFFPNQEASTRTQLYALRHISLHHMQGIKRTTLSMEIIAGGGKSNPKLIKQDVIPRANVHQLGEMLPSRFRVWGLMRDP